MIKSHKHVSSQIQGFYAAGHSISSIATIVQRDRKAIWKQIQSPPGTISDEKRMGHPPKSPPIPRTKFVMHSKTRLALYCHMSLAC